MDEALYICGLIASGLAGFACIAIGVTYAVLKKNLKSKLDGEYGTEK